MAMNSNSSSSMPGISLAEYRSRRERVLAELGGSVGVVFAGEGEPPLLGKWRPDANFMYLTGIEGEQGAAVVFDPTADDPKRRIVLLLRPLNLELEKWDGYRDEIGTALRTRTGFDTVMRTNYLPRVLVTAGRRAKKLACLHAFAPHTAEVSKDLAVFRKVAERIPGCAIEDRTMLLAEMRAVKSDAEAALMREACAATAAGYDAAFSTVRPGAKEGDVQRAMEAAYVARGATGSAYNAIVGSGLMGTVLHYMENSGECREGELLVIDSGASFEGYACDVTRTLPVSGTFTREQRELYGVVLAAQKAAIKACRVGAFMWQVDKAARDVIEAAGYGDYYIHGIGHQLGMEVHDITPDGALKAGMVVTIEPGVYIPEKKMGIRIEDDILVTKSGNENLTAMIPKEIEEVEGAMGGGKSVKSAGANGQAKAPKRGAVGAGRR